MRKPSFFTALFAVSLLSGAALAEKPHGAVDRLRARGDVVDKSYRAERVAAPRIVHQASSPAARALPDRAAQRVSCSDLSLDCAAARGASHARVEASRDAASGRPSRPPAFLDKVLGSDRTAFNEAGEAQGMSARAASRVWSHGAPGATGKAAIPLAGQEQRARGEAKASETRVACNEGDQCMASSKATKKEWSYQAVKAGTWQGPEAKKPSGAEKAIAAMKQEKAASKKP